jgi:hypothetical protein
MVRAEYVEGARDEPALPIPRNLIKQDKAAKFHGISCFDRENVGEHLIRTRVRENGYAHELAVAVESGAEARCWKRPGVVMREDKITGRSVVQYLGHVVFRCADEFLRLTVACAAFSPTLI